MGKLVSKQQGFKDFKDSKYFVVVPKICKFGGKSFFAPFCLNFLWALFVLAILAPLGSVPLKNMCLMDLRQKPQQDVFNFFEIK